MFLRKTTLKVLEDFYRKDFNEGDIVGFFEGRVKILNKNYQNQFGSFILCEYMDVKEHDTKREKRKGKCAHPDHPYEVVGTIHVPGYRNLLGGIGFFVNNRNCNEVIGLTYQQTWDLIFHEGAVNAEAFASNDKIFRTKLIDSIEGLPSLDSTYWKIPAYDQTGKPYAKFTKEALVEIRKGMKYAVQNRVRENNHQRIIEENDLKEINQVAEMIKQAEKIVVLAGAGLSTSSGIPDYRSAAEGVWLKNPELLGDLNQTSFERSPKRFWSAFYQLIEHSLSSIVPFPTEEALVATLNAIEPNEGHRFFSWLTQGLGKSVTVITQNVDGLEAKAGNQKVIQVHGNIHESYCPACGKIYSLDKVLKKGRVPRCECQSVLRPNVVFFGDAVHDFDQAEKEVDSADLLLVVGTSLEVSPFNQLSSGRNGGKVVLLNGSTITKQYFDYTLIGDISMICRELKNRLEPSTKARGGQNE
jgi:NAD-dependent SIR2 family protein deacetylase